jgi:murein DD-endopeptidase MepM/ murein hydrolase activator NlpD
MSRIVLPLLLALSLTAIAAEPPPLSFTGEPVQGGLLFGLTAPGARVQVDGRPVRVSPNGAFLVGFGREQIDPVTVSVIGEDGITLSRTLDIRPRVYSIQRVDGLPGSRVTPPPEVSQRIAREAARISLARNHDDDRADFESGFIWPLQGPITGVYGSQRILNGEPRQPHYGVDIAAPSGTPVVAPADAVVSLVEPDMYFSGGTLLMDHGHGLSSTFIHLSKILVAQDQQVKQGQVVAEVGATGRASGPHLDWRMNLFETRLDPAQVVGPMPEPADPGPAK